jgi:hypothetical protein
VIEERKGIPGSTFDGFFFTENSIPDAVVRGRVRIKLSGQNRNLDSVKSQMVKSARAKGATAIANFKYGQKRGFFVWDDMSWQGSQPASARETIA